MVFSIRNTHRHRFGKSLLKGRFVFKGYQTSFPRFWIVHHLKHGFMNHLSFRFTSLGGCCTFFNIDTCGFGHSNNITTTCTKEKLTVTFHLCRWARQFKQLLLLFFRSMKLITLGLTTGIPIMVHVQFFINKNTHVNHIRIPMTNILRSHDVT